ncbi:MAG: MBL fold metallo-hydrolase [Nocardioidaceae bacterium]
MKVTPGEGFVEVAERCFVARYSPWDVSVGAVIGTAGILVIDTRASVRQGRELLDDLRRLEQGADVRWVVNTHEHFDHVFGNRALEAADIYAHENAAAGIDASAARVKQLIAAEPEGDPDRPEITAQVLADVMASEPLLPNVTFSSVATIDLGDRYVELVYPGRGHTSGDLVLRVPDADVLFVGDLVEESGPPAYGDDSFPLDWPGSLDLVVGMLTARSMVVPGHGQPVDKVFVEAQRSDVADVATRIGSQHLEGVPLDDVFSSGYEWPFEVEHLRAAVERGYSQLGTQVASRPTLPLA